MRKLLWLLALTAALVLSGCSSVPDFRPSKPLEEASSVNEALDLCAAYQIKGEQNSSGRAMPARVSTLVPWISCFESVFRKFPVAQESEELIAFFRALQSRHANAHPPDAKVVEWASMNYAVRTVVDHIKNTDLDYAPEERKVVERQLPGLGIYLAETGRFSSTGVSTRSSLVLSDLAKLRRQFEHPDTTPGRKSGEEAKTLGLLGPQDEILETPPRPLPLNERQREYCKRYRLYRNMVHNVEELAEYKRVLDQSTYKDVGNVREQVARNRIETRYEDLLKEAEQTRDELVKERYAIQGNASWFKNGHCFQKGQLPPR